MSSTAQRATASATITFAAAIALTAGLLMIFQGIQILFAGATSKVDFDYVYAFNPTVWGLGHIVLGAAMALLGVAMVLRKEWARLAGMCVAIVTIIMSFMRLPFPGASGEFVIIAFSGLLIWALSTRKPADDDGRPWGT